MKLIYFVSPYDLLFNCVICAVTGCPMKLIYFVSPYDLLYNCVICAVTGCPMKLIYFVSPYDLLNKKTKSPHPMTVEGKPD